MLLIVAIVAEFWVCCWKMVLKWLILAVSVVVGLVKVNYQLTVGDCCCCGADGLVMSDFLLFSLLTSSMLQTYHSASTGMYLDVVLRGPLVAQVGMVGV